MAIAYIREYAAMALSANGQPQCGLEPAMADQVLTTSGTSAASAAFGTETTFVAISTPAAQAVCAVFGSAPTATTTGLRLPANGVYFFGVAKGHKVALIDVT